MSELRWRLADEERDGQPALFSVDGLAGPERGTGKLSGLEFLHVTAKKILNEVPPQSRMPFRWTINVYRGCSHSCRYCFARPTHEYLGLNLGEDFDRKIVVKINAVEKLRAELTDPKWTGEVVAMGTNTDPYQRCEGKYRLTRGVLEALAERGNPFSILTKSPLVLRDLDVLTAAAAAADVTVNFSIGTLDEKVWRATEPGTPNPRRRVEALRQLAAAGIRTGALIAPVLPGLSDRPEQLHEVADAVRAARGPRSRCRAAAPASRGSRAFPGLVGRLRPRSARRLPAPIRARGVRAEGLRGAVARPHPVIVVPDFLEPGPTVKTLHEHKKCVVNQREVGVDTQGFATALKRVLRQDPDIILVGELRDLETVSTAITAAETGHLVLATLHTQSAAQTIDRVIDIFPSHQQQEIRAQLSTALQGVVTEALVHRTDGGGRTFVCEVMLDLFLTQLQSVQPRAVMISQLTEDFTAAAGKGGKTTLSLTMQAFVAPISAAEQVQLSAASGK